MATLSREQLEAELERCLGEERRLTGALAEEKAHSQTIEQRKVIVDKKLGQTEAVVDTLRVELDSLHMTNDQLAQEAKREILALKDEMNKMRMDYDREIQRLQEKLTQLQKDRDSMEDAYQFAKDELMVIKATLADYEESQSHMQYIKEDSNPTLVNRMQSEWNRVDYVDDAPARDGGEFSPKRKAFARDFRRSHASPQDNHDPSSMDIPQRQGALGASPWRY